MSEWLKEHAWKLLWRSAMACYRFRLLLRSQPLNSDHVYSIDRRNLGRSRPIDSVTSSYVTVGATLKEHPFKRDAFKPAADDSSRGCRISLRQAVFVFTTKSTSQLSTCNRASA